jgi:hypothetical protein
MNDDKCRPSVMPKGTALTGISDGLTANIFSNPDKRRKNRNRRTAIRPAEQSFENETYVNV